MDEPFKVFHYREKPIERLKRLIVAFRALPSDGDMDFRVGETSAGEPGVLVSISGLDFPFSGSEVPAIIETLHSTIKDFPATSRKEGIDNLLRGFEAAWKQANSRGEGK